MKIITIKLLIISLVMLAAGSAFATSSPYEDYNVTIDTSSLNGTNGYLYLQYNPSSAVNSTARVYGFSTDGTLGAQSVNVVNGSAVTGTLPGNVVFANTNNANGINDYNHAELFGNSINFNLLFASNSFGLPVGGSSTFSLGLYQDEFGASPLLGGTLFTVDLLNNGTTSYQVFSNANVSTVPEPGTIVLLGAGLLGLCIYNKRRMSITALEQYNS